MILEDVKKYQLPDGPGVYIFLGSKSEKEEGRRLYIGKATSLRMRVRSYFVDNVREKRSPLIERMVEESQSIEWIETDSVLEALVLEAHLIKKHQPRFNSKEKDNKSFSYAVVSNEEFPRIVVVRGRELTKIQIEQEKGILSGPFSARTTSPSNIIRKYGIKKIYGPFTSTSTLKTALSIIRRMFPYRDAKCIPTGKPCFNYQLGLCPGTCVDEISKREYGRTMRNINLFFEGKKRKVIENLSRDMHTYAKKEEFEKAEITKKLIWSLEHINDVALLKKDMPHEGTGESGKRVEAYDVAHFGGEHVVGVMTVVVDGENRPDEYRKFIIQGTHGGGDTGALEEILSRRFAHPEWEFPTLVVVDGGKAQINKAHKVLSESGLPIPVVGVVKDDRHKPREIVGDPEIVHTYESSILQANDEAHRFAIGFHRKKRTIV